MEKPLLALHPPLALPSSHRWSWFLLSWVRAAMWGALLEVECRSRRLALSEEQRPTVTSRRWLVFPVPCVSQWGLVGREDSEGVSGAATLSEGEEGGIAGSSLPISPADLATLGTRVPLSLPLLCKGGRRRLVCSFPLPPLPRLADTSLGTRPHGLMQLQVLGFCCWEMRGEGLWGGALKWPPAPRNW